MELSDKNSKGRVYITMDDYQKIDDKQRFAFFRTFEVYVDEKNEGYLKVDISKAETDGPLEFPFSIPKKYTKGIFPDGSQQDCRWQRCSLGR